MADKHFIISPRDAKIALNDIDKGLSNGGSDTILTIKKALRKFVYPVDGNKKSRFCEDCGYIPRPGDVYCPKCARKL